MRLTATRISKRRQVQSTARSLRSAAGSRHRPASLRAASARWNRAAAALHAATTVRPRTATGQGDSSAAPLARPRARPPTTGYARSQRPPRACAFGDEQSGHPRRRETRSSAGARLPRAAAYACNQARRTVACPDRPACGHKRVLPSPETNQLDTLRGRSLQQRGRVAAVAGGSSQKPTPPAAPLPARSHRDARTGPEPSSVGLPTSGEG